MPFSVGDSLQASPPSWSDGAAKGDGSLSDPGGARSPTRLCARRYPPGTRRRWRRGRMPRSPRASESQGLSPISRGGISLSIWRDFWRQGAALGPFRVRTGPAPAFRQKDSRRVFGLSGLALGSKPLAGHLRSTYLVRTRARISLWSPSRLRCNSPLSKMEIERKQKRNGLLWGDPNPDSDPA